LNINIIVCP